MMENLMGGFRAVATALCLAFAFSSGGFAQDYPTKPINLVVPAPPGGGTDILGRMVAEGISKALGRPVIVHNRGGGSGMIAADMVLKSPADGYTLFMVYSGVLTMNQALFTNIRYDPVRDFAPVAMFADVPQVLIVHSSVPANSVADLIKLAKDKPGKLNYASAAVGGATHLAMEQFKQLAGVDIVHVPYKGGAPAMTDLLGGQVQVMVNNLVEVLPHLKGGKIRALAMATSKRTPALPDLPTVAESGLAGYEMQLWYGLVAPAGTPPAIVAKLNEVVRIMQQQPEVKARLAAMGAYPVAMSPAELSALIKREGEKWTRVVRQAGIKPG